MNMRLCEVFNKQNGLAKRIVVGKTVGFLLSFAGVIALAMTMGLDGMMKEAVGIVMWYSILGIVVGAFGVWDKHPVFGFKMYKIRGVVIGAFMNLALALIAGQALSDMFGSMFGATISMCYITALFVLEGALMGLVIDMVTTRKYGEGKKLLD